MIFPLLYPANVTSDFGPRVNPLTGDPSDYHYGVDLACPIGTEVVAALGGKVAAITFDSSNGHRLVLAHEDPKVKQTIYCHLTMVVPGLHVGQYVFAGQVVALSGNTGASTGPHLHFHVDGPEGAIDPMIFLANPEPRRVVILADGVSWKMILLGLAVATGLWMMWR